MINKNWFYNVFEEDENGVIQDTKSFHGLSNARQYMQKRAGAIFAKRKIYDLSIHPDSAELVTKDGKKAIYLYIGHGKFED